MILAISGPPGSGKTTVAERIAAKEGYALVSAGSLFRTVAKEWGMSLAAFGEYATDHPEVDTDIDRRVVDEVVRLAAEGRDVVVEGRLSAHMLSRRGVECLKVWIDAPRAVRAERIAGRDRTSVKEAKRAISEREKLERSRYKRTYGIDLRDTKPFDLVLDSGDRSPEDLAAEILARVAG